MLSVYNVAVGDRSTSGLGFKLVFAHILVNRVSDDRELITTRVVSNIATGITTTRVVSNIVTEITIIYPLTVYKQVIGTSIFIFRQLRNACQW